MDIVFVCKSRRYRLILAIHYFVVVLFIWASSVLTFNSFCFSLAVFVYLVYSSTFIIVIIVVFIILSTIYIFSAFASTLVGPLLLFGLRAVRAIIVVANQTKRNNNYTQTVGD